MPVSNRLCFQVNLRDALTCQECGMKPLQMEQYHRGFEYHHILPLSQNGTDNLNNLILLCHKCHLTQHRKPDGVEKYRPKPPVIEFDCAQCGTTLNSETVEMNCGYYCCSECHITTHLFEHFGLNNALIN